MAYRVKELLFLLTILLSFSTQAASFDERTIKMGPLLHFDGEDLTNHTWRVSALYVLDEAETIPDLVFKNNGSKKFSQGKSLGVRFGHEFIRYDMELPLAAKRKKVRYRLNGESQRHKFFVPARGQSVNMLAHSCNGTQNEHDRKHVGGIMPMWAEINHQHKIKRFELQLGMGDQLYADGLVVPPETDLDERVSGNVHGVFALPTVLGWLKHKSILQTAAFTEEMAQELEWFYLHQYIRHYNEPAFKKTVASIPILAQPDDHDFFDGRGSYPGYLQNSNVMSGIEKIATWYAFTIQHQINVEELCQNQQETIPSYSFLHHINGGKTAILGVDTRSERTQTQVVSPKTWETIFKELDYLDASCEHLIVILGIPVVFASTRALDKSIKMAERIPPLGVTLSHTPGLSGVFAKNAFGLFDLKDDSGDGWSHKNHIDERNEMIFNFQELARKKQVRVTFVGGDVHVGGGGKIFSRNNGFKDCSDQAIWQVISSPVGNIPIGKATTQIIGTVAQRKKKLPHNCAMRLFPLDRVDGHKNTDVLLPYRNFASLQLMPDNSLHITWSAEIEKCAPHQFYELFIPPVKYLEQP